ncbi:MAG: methyl-accepting chemotaxis protein [Holosporales bacterium]|jgi:PAS domain S-box-containing protein
MPRFDVRLKLVALLLVFGLLPLLSVMPIIFGKLNEMRDGSLSNMRITAGTVGELIDRNLFERYGDVQAFGYNGAALDNRNWFRPSADNPLISSMNSYMVNYGLYKLMMLLDLEGRVAAVNNIDNKGNPLETIGLYNRNFKDARWFQQAKNKNFLSSPSLDGTAVQQPAYEKIVADAYREDGFTIAFSAPVYNSKKDMIGVWVTFADFGLVESIVADIYNQAKSNGATNIAFAIQDNNGTALVNYDPTAQGTSNYRRDSSSIGQKKLATMGIPAANDALKNSQGSSISNDHNTETAVSWEASNGAIGFPGLGWTVIVHEPASEAFANVISTKALLKQIMIVAVIGLGGIGALVGTFASRPIQKATDVAKRLADADYKMIIDGLERKDEFGNLAQALNNIKNTVADYSGQLAAISRSQAVIEFDTKGYIRNANQNFLHVTGYTMDEIKGKHHSIFVEPAEKDSPEYQQFWANLNAGQSKITEFKRIAKGGRKFWINASYNPILDPNGNIVKIVKFANEITDTVETRLENEIGMEESMHVLQGVASGDLTLKMNKDYKGTFATIKNAINTTVEKLTETVVNIKQASELVGSAASEISSGSADLSQRTENQASSLEETAASMEELTSTVRQNAQNTDEATKISLKAQELAQKGGDVVDKAVAAMSQIEQSSKKVSDIIGVIDEIAFQTNLLALNAAVEAARAGDAGKGFAVVASEVRSLAGRSAASSKEIKQLIQESNEQVRVGAELVNQAGSSLKEIVSTNNNVNTIISEISGATKEQTNGIEEINSAITQMDEMTQQNAALVEENTAAAQSLVEQANQLEQLVSFFKISQDAARQQTSQSVQTPVVRPTPPPRPVRKQNPGRKPSGNSAPAQNYDKDWQEF